MKNKWLLFFALVAFIILRLPSLFEPHWYGDEGIYAAITYGMESGKVLYTQLWDNKPPLIYYLYSLGDSHNRLLIIRSLNLIAGLLTLVGLWKLIEALTISKMARNLAIIFAAIILGTPILEGNIANAENFFIALNVFGFVFLLQKKPRYVLSGVLFGLSFLFKFHPIFDFAAAGIYLLLTQKSLKKTGLFIAGFFIPLLAQSGILLLQGNLGAGLSIIFLNNFSYTKSYSHGLQSIEFRSLVLVVGLMLSSWLFYVKRISRTLFFILAVFLFEVYAGFFGGRKYVHYLIQTIPATVLFFSVFAEKMLEEKQSLAKKTMYPTALIVLFWLVIKAFSFGEGTPMIYNLPRYYADFFSYITKNSSYFISDVDERFSRLNSELQKYDKKDLYIYSNSAWLYDVLEIYPPIPVIVGYHRTFVGEKNFIAMLEQAKPKIVVYDTHADRSDDLLNFLAAEYVYEKNFEEYQIWSKK